MDACNERDAWPSIFQLLNPPSRSTRQEAILDTELSCHWNDYNPSCHLTAMSQETCPPHPQMTSALLNPVNSKNREREELLGKAVLL